ncbi:MAG TPA: AMP-binding protein [Nitrospiria bacterium]|nr:AMP-binding protein [Nitrospiria bacterium]
MTADQARISYHHRGGGEPLLGATIPEHFSSVAAQWPDREAVVSLHQNRRLTYAQLARAVDDLARGLAGLGFETGDRIAIWSTDNIEWLLLQLATARLGAVLVNINPAYRARELAYALQRSEVQGLFVIPRFRTSDYVAMLVELIPEMKAGPPGHWRSAAFPFLRHVAAYDPAAAEKTDRPQTGLLTWQEVLAAGDRVTAEQLGSITAALDRDDPINIQYTSGTTGFPKAVVLTHHNILNNAWFTARALRFTETDRLAVPVPFYHCFGMVVSNLMCLSVGACLVIPAEHFDPEQTLRAVERERCTAIHGVPTMFIAELEHPEFRAFDLSTLRTGIMAGAPCPPLLMRRVMEEMHCREMLIAYGETESSPITHITAPDDTLERRAETVGTNLPHQEVKIVDLSTGRTVPPGQVGEICFRGYHVMRGYYGDEEATRRAIDPQGWLHSGDLGMMDGDGYVQVTGRLKEMIIRGGEKIFPREIEDYLFTHPNVAEAAVFGVPDPFYGEEVAAWIQLHPGKRATEEEIREFCKGRIAHFKIPRYISFVKEFPMTVTGKIQKFRMREIAVEQLRAGATASSRETGRGDHQ